MKESEVYWDKKEKIIGILGLAPYATVDFYKKILDATPAKKDWEHIRILIDNNPKIPSRGRALDLGETDPSPFMRDAIVELHNNGADFIIIPCNTAHIFYDSTIKGLENVEVLNMIEETSKYVLSQNKNLKAIGVMASSNSTKYRLYDKYFDNYDIKVLYLPDDQIRISELIEIVKLGDTSGKIKNEFKDITTKLINLGAEGIIIGCTELSLLIRNGDITIPVYDSNEILAEVAVRKAKNEI